MTVDTRNVTSIDLKHLRYFVGVVDAGSLSRAASRLHIVQPALSNRMTALEQYLGTVLLHRSPLGVRPTEAGKILYASATRILRELQSVADELAVLSTVPAGTVRFGCSPSTSTVLAKPLIDAVIQQLPHVRFSFVSAASIDIYQRLLRGDVDLALIYKDGALPGVAGTPLVRENMFLVAIADDPRFRDTESVSAQRAGELDLVLATQSRHFGTAVIHDRFLAAGVRLRVVAQIDSTDALFDMLAPGGPVSIVPWAACAQRERAGSIQVVPVSGIDLWRELEFCVPSEHPLTPAAEAVASLVRSVVAQLIGAGNWRHAECI